MDDLYPLMEVAPGYGKVLVIDFILDFVTIFILSMLMVQYIRRKHRTFELTLFFQMCLCNLLMVICAIVFDVVPIFWKASVDNVYDILFNWWVIGWIFDLVFIVTLLAQWLIYVEYTLHQSRDLIRRRYPAALAVYVAAVAIMFISIPIGFWENAPFDENVVYDVLTFISHGIFLFYIVAAYVVLFLEKKRNRIPAYIRLTPTTLCVLAGYGVNLILVGNFYPILPPFFALGLLFADYFMYRRLRYINPRTGIYNSKYLSELISFSEKKHLKGATVVRFKVERGSDVMIEILKDWLPEQSKAIDMGDGLFLLVSDAVKDYVVQRFIFFISEQAKDRGIPVDAGFETDHDGPMAEVLRKYC